MQLQGTCSVTLVAIEPDGRVGTSVALSAHAASVVSASLSNYGIRGNYAPWLGYMTFDDGRNVGTCGFVMPPSDGVVEIAYYTFPEHEGNGYAQQAARALVKIARAAEPNVTITAHTLPAEGPSCRVLAKCGFKHTGSVEHPEDGPIWVWTFTG